MTSSTVDVEALIKENVPVELRIRPQWVAWKAVPKDDGKTDKLPINPHNGGLASTNDLLTWGSLDKALKAMRQFRLAGVGFVFSSGDRYTGIDIDHVPMDKIPDDVIALNSYTEYSPSGQGYHIIVRGKIPESIKRTEIEMYSSERFFTVTGQHVEMTPTTIESRQNEITNIYRRYKPSQTERQVQPVARPNSIDDQALLDRAFGAKDGASFRALWNGDVSAYNGDDSVADWHLCQKLAFWTGRDSARIDSLFRQSGLMRDKWLRQNYREATINDAIEMTSDVYEPYSPQDVIRLIRNKNGSSNSTELALEPDSPMKRPYILHYAWEALLPQPPIEWVVDALFSRGSVNIVVGAPGTKKTWSTLDCAVSVAAGQDWLGRCTEQGPVLLIDEESGARRLNRRLGQIMRGHSAGAETPITYTCLEMFDILKSEDIQAIDEIMTRVQPVLVLIDALADVMPGGDENAVSDTHPVFQRLRALAEKYQCAIIVIHHANKVGGYRGSTAIAGAVDLMLMLESEKDSSNINFMTAKTRDTEPQNFGAKINFNPIEGLTEGPVFLSSAEAEARVEERSRAEKYVLWYLGQHSGRAHLTSIRRNADSCSESSALKAVYKLTSNGIIRRCDGGKTGEKAEYEIVIAKQNL